MSKIDAQPPEDYHEEFDFYFNPAAKEQLKALRRKLNELPENERLYELYNYAVRKGIMTNVNYDVGYEEKFGQKKPSGSVKMPAYGRLLNAYKWLGIMEAKGNQIVQPVTNADLPF